MAFLHKITALYVADYIHITHDLSINAYDSALCSTNRM